MNFINLTPHNITLNDGTIYPASGIVARVSSVYVDKGNGFYTVDFGDIVNLPEPVNHTFYIVSGLVANATNRPDVIAPATGHADAIRINGQIVSVPGFIIK